MKPTSEDIIRRTNRFGARNYQPLPVVISKAEGVWVYDPEGRKYLDMLSGYSALNQGHRHPRIIRALKDQADSVTLTSRAFHNERQGGFYERLSDYTGKPMILPMNTGAEAVETAIKAARRWAYFRKNVPEDQAEIIVCEGNFHGRTVTVTSFSSNPEYKRGFGPFTPGFVVIPYGDAGAWNAPSPRERPPSLSSRFRGRAASCSLLPATCSRPQPFASSGAYCLSPTKFRPALDERVPLRLRCGIRGAGCLHPRQGAGGGVLPISAVAADREVLEVFEPGSHGSTFGGNPLACAVATAAIQVVQDEKLAERSLELGDYFLGLLRQLTNPLIRDIRGRGLFIGVELAVPARAYCEQLKNKGLLCKETHENVIRLAPPLTIAKSDLDWAYSRIAEVLG